MITKITDHPVRIAVILAIISIATFKTFVILYVISILHCCVIPDISDKVSYSRRTNLCGELTLNNVGQEVTVCGWLQYQRMAGVFLIIRDWTGTVQTVLTEEVH